MGIEPMELRPELSQAWQTIIQPPFELPLSKEDKEKYFGDALLKAWKIEFEKRCWGSPQYAEMSFHTLFGQLPAIRRIPVTYEDNYSDIRVHTMLFQRSGTGKGRGYDFTAIMAEKLDLHCITPDSMSDGVLLGSYEDIDDEQVHIYGLLDPERSPQVNIVMQNEATLIIDTKKVDWAKDFMTYYQKAMNPIGTPDNRIEKANLHMKGELVRINPVVSFYLTTYPPDRLLETITKAGFIQRMKTLYNIHTFEERVEHWETMAIKTGKVREGDTSESEIIAALKYINTHYHKNNYLMVAPETHRTFSLSMKELYRPLIRVNKAMREHLGDFVPRIYENMVKISYQHAMIRLSPLVENVDIVYSMSIAKPAWQRMITYMEESEEIVQPTLNRWKKWRNQAADVYDQLIVMQKRRSIDTGGWIKKETLVTTLSSPDMGWDKSKGTTRSRLDKMIIDLKWFEEKKIEGVKYTRLRAQSR